MDRDINRRRDSEPLLPSLFVLTVYTVSEIGQFLVCCHTDRCCILFTFACKDRANILRAFPVPVDKTHLPRWLVVRLSHARRGRDVTMDGAHSKMGAIRGSTLSDEVLGQRKTNRGSVMPKLALYVLEKYRGISVE